MKLYTGIDEVGLGCLAGPIYAVALTIHLESLLEWPLRDVTDSKKTTAKQRSAMIPSLTRLIEDRKAEVGVGLATVEEINRLGPDVAWKLAMRRALHAATIEVNLTPELTIVDGNRGVDGARGPQLREPKADGRYFPVAAASILAKDIRDRQMVSLHNEYPEYNWKQNAGYPTQEHINAVLKYGRTPHHRDAATGTVERKARR